MSDAAPEFVNIETKMLRKSFKKVNKLSYEKWREMYKNHFTQLKDIYKKLKDDKELTEEEDKITDFDPKNLEPKMSLKKFKSKLTSKQKKFINTLKGRNVELRLKSEFIKGVTKIYGLKGYYKAFKKSKKIVKKILKLHKKINRM
jgi:hypothetical protein